MPDWKAFRHQFPLLDRYIYLNACSLGPLPRRGRAALERYANDWDTKGTPVWYSDWLPLLEREPVGVPDRRRSEEHTSELQSRSDLVCRLLLEKKKATHRPDHPADA